MSSEKVKRRFHYVLSTDNVKTLSEEEADLLLETLAENLPLFRSLEELVLLHNESLADVIKCEDHLKDSEGDTLFWRRTLIRVFSAYVEGTLHLMKQTTVQGATFTLASFTADEISKLNDKDPKTDGFRFMTLPDNLKFASQCFCKLFHSKLALDYSTNGYECFRQTVHIRNRLMHLKATSDLDISKAEEFKARQARRWFAGHIAIIVRDCFASFERFIQAGCTKNPIA